MTVVDSYINWVMRNIRCELYWNTCMHDFTMSIFTVVHWEKNKYHQTSNIRGTLGNTIVDHSDVVEALPVGVAPTTSSLST